MIITKGNIVFRRLVHDDIELVRNWRNSSEITQFMEYREHITPKMQEKWFESVNNNNNLYFIIEYKGEKIGLINGKDIDWDRKIMETGVFIANEKFINTEVPILSVLTFGELGVVTFELTATAHILRTNKRAKRYNKLIGFRLAEGQENIENQLYIMTIKSYLKNARLIRKAFNKLMGTAETVLTFEAHDKLSGFDEFLFNKLNKDKIDLIEVSNNLKSLRFKNLPIQ